MLSAMTRPVPVLNDTTFVAVNVHVRDTEMHCKLHAHTSVLSLTEQLQEHFLELVSREDDEKYLKSERVQWALEYGPIRRRLDPEVTLDAAGVTPGADLYLTHRTRTESYPVLRDDIAEGAAEVSKRMFDVLDGRDTRRMGVIALPAATVLVCLIGLADVFSVRSGDRLAVAVILGVLAVMSMSMAAVLSRVREGYGDLAGALCVAAYISAAFGAFVAVPREPSIWQVTTAGAAVGVVVAVLAPVTKNRPASLHVGVGAAVVCLVALGVVRSAISSSSQAVAAQLIFLSAVLMCCGPPISRMVGRLRGNYIPTTGEPLVTSEETVAKVSKRSTSGHAIEAILNQEDRVRTTIHALVGMMSAAACLLVGASAAGGYFTRSYEWHMFVLVAASAVVSVAVGRGLVLRSASWPLLVSGPTAAAVYLVGRFMSPHPADVGVVLAGAVPLLVFTVVSSIWAVRAKSLHSPIEKRRLEIIATLAVISMFPLVVLIMESWSRVRNR
jgi:type VII secretion integral membrane protein EccD